MRVKGSGSVVQSVIAYTAIFGLLCVGAYTDAKRRIIPNWVNLGIFGCGFLIRDIRFGTHFLNLGVMVAGLVIAAVLTKKKSGGGDIKLYCALASSLTIIPTAIILAISAAAMGIQSRAAKKRGDVVKYPVCCYVAPAYLVWVVGSVIVHRLA